MYLDSSARRNTCPDGAPPTREFGIRMAEDSYREDAAAGR